MNIKIEFLLKGQSQFSQKEISVEEYFDIEENETIDIHCVPKFSQPYMYLNFNIEEILLVVIILEINGEKRILRQTIWNNGNNLFTERTDIGSENDNYKEMILSIRIDETTDLYEVIRLFVGDNFTVPVYHSLFYSGDNGSEIEKPFNTDVYLEMIKNRLI
jgi:hypothetical protein